MRIGDVMNLPEMTHVTARATHLVNTLTRVWGARVVTCTPGTRILGRVGDQARGSHAAASVSLANLGPGAHPCGRWSINF